MIGQSGNKMALSKMQTPIRVLVVEDHEIAQRVAQLVLQGLGCHADVARNGKEALERFAQNHYDLVFMDIGLPDMDGLVVTTSLRSQEKKALTASPPIPIIGLTAHAGAQMRLQVIEAGMNDFLVKPLTKENCLAILNQFVYERQDLVQS